MKVFRVEHYTEINENSLCHVGPYGCSEFIHSEDWKTTNHDINESHPTPIEDGISCDFFNQSNVYCGFKKIEHLNRWFNNEEQTNLAKLGFVIAEYETDEYEVGNIQIMFKPKGKRIKVYDLVWKDVSINEREKIDLLIDYDYLFDLVG